MVVRDGMRLVGWGSVGGLLAAFAGTRAIDSWLFGVTPTDRFTFALVCGVLVAAGALACAGPALRAVRISPLVALRME